jgi:hypothetical protein
MISFCKTILKVETSVFPYLYKTMEELFSELHLYQQIFLRYLGVLLELFSLFIINEKHTKNLITINFILDLDKRYSSISLKFCEKKKMSL